MRKFGLFLVILSAFLHSPQARATYNNNWLVYANDTRDNYNPNWTPEARQALCLNQSNRDCSLRDAVEVAEKIYETNAPRGPISIKIKMLGATYPLRAYTVRNISTGRDVYISDIFLRTNVEIEGNDSTDGRNQTVIDSSLLGDTDATFNISGDHLNVLFSDVVFINGNRPQGRGSAIAISAKSSWVSVLQCNFYRNHASAGGAIALAGEYTTVYIWDTKFTENSATDGGAIYANRGYVQLISSSFKDNVASQGKDVMIEGEARVQNQSGIVQIDTENGGAIVL